MKTGAISDDLMQCASASVLYGLMQCWSQCVLYGLKW